MVANLLAGPVPANSLFASLLYCGCSERGGGLQAPECIKATSFPGSLPGTVEQSLSVLGLVHESKICDRCHDAGNLLLCIKHRYSLSRNTWQQVVGQFGPALGANGLEYLARGWFASEMRWLQFPGNVDLAFGKECLEDQTARGIVDRQDVTKPDGADRKKCAAIPTHDCWATLGPDGNARTCGIPTGELLRVPCRDLYRVYAFQGANADTQRGWAKIVVPGLGILHDEPLLHQALKVSVCGRAASTGLFGDDAKSHGSGAVGQDVQESRGNGNGLNVAGAFG